MKSKKRLILVELNEINFDVVQDYIKNGHQLSSFKKIIDEELVITYSEQEYQNLEPWIQWPSIHTGKTYNEHQVFRLGDFVNSNYKQFFEKVEEGGFSVGAISPMNASNNLVNPTYFIPDPWTETYPDKSFFSKAIHSAVSQAVNDNSQSKLTISSIISLALSFIFLVNPKKYLPMIFYAVSSIRKPWKRALFLDLLLHEIHVTLFKRKKTEFSTVFFNAGAHIQHHYFFNSKFVQNLKLQNPSWYINKNDDPFLDMLITYNKMLKEILEIDGTEVIISTGLSQKPFDYLKFYYRLKDHQKFLNELNISFKKVTPRMTRDFLITCNSSDEAKICEEKLKKITLPDGKKLFEEIDNRGNDLFVVLTYPDEIKENTYIEYDNSKINLYDRVTFVAIKNGEHQSKGFAYFTEGVREYAPENKSHVSRLHESVLNFFQVNPLNK